VRIVSLPPTATEIVSALGGGGDPLGVAVGERAPTTLDLAELLAAWLHPDRFPAQLERYGQAVRRVDAGLGVHPVRP
jgi:ABC-type Fe3+-hydroxamate transport system substrate-binding protein